MKNTVWLDAYLSEMKPEIDARVGSNKYQGEWPPEKLQHCISANDSVDARIQPGT